MPAEPAPAARSRPRSFWPQFTLRVLLIFVTAVGVGLAYWTHRARQQRFLAEKMNRVGIDYHYDFGLTDDVNRSSVPPLLLSSLGVDFFHRVEAIRMGEFDTNRGECVAILTDLSRLGGLRRISIESKSITDHEVAVLEANSRLEALTILCHEHHGMGQRMHTPPLTDRTLERIARLPALKTLRIEGLYFTSDGLKSLSKSATLETVCVHHCDKRVKREDLRSFRKSGRVKYLRVTRYNYGDTGFEIVADWGEPPW